MPQKFANAAKGFLSASITNSATTLTISSGALFPVADTGTGAVGGATDWFKLILDDGTNIEIVYVRTHTAASDTCSNVLRGQEGTTALALPAGTAVGLRVTAGDMALSVGRETLYANRTYYVATTGSDSNDGLIVGSPFLTIQKAVDVVCALDMSTHQVTIQLSDGTYAEGAALKSYVGALPPIIKGNTATPSNVHINRTTGNGCILNSLPGTWVISDMKLSHSSGSAMQVSNKAAQITFGNIVFGVCSNYHIYADRGSVQANGNYSISGNAQYHYISLYQGLIITGSRTMTLLASVTFTAYAYITRQSFLNCEAMTFTLGGFTVTGQKYVVDGNSVVYGTGGNTNYLPGSTAGATATGGQYV